MERIARDSGGADFDAREKGLADNLRHIGDQLRSSYELAYHSTNVVRKGEFHKIMIQPRRPDLLVRAKTGYFAR
jgi:Ca-activated chloride channel family protein